MTEEEKQELELLRQEKHQRLQMTRVEQALQQAGIPTTFASLLVGQDDQETDKKTAQFCSSYQAALAEDVRSRLPVSAPIVTAPPAPRPRRGIQRLR